MTMHFVALFSGLHCPQLHKHPPREPGTWLAPCFAPSELNNALKFNRTHSLRKKECKLSFKTQTCTQYHHMAYIQVAARVMKKVLSGSTLMALSQYMGESVHCGLTQYACIHLHCSEAHLHEAPSHPAHMHRQHAPLQSSLHLHIGPQLQLTK